MPIIRSEVFTNRIEPTYLQDNGTDLITPKFGISI